MLSLDGLTQQTKPRKNFVLVASRSVPLSGLVGISCRIFSGLSPGVRTYWTECLRRNGLPSAKEGALCVHS